MGTYEEVLSLLGNEAVHYLQRICESRLAFPPINLKPTISILLMRFDDEGTLQSQSQYMAPETPVIVATFPEPIDFSEFDNSLSRSRLHATVNSQLTLALLDFTAKTNSLTVFETRANRAHECCALFVHLSKSDYPSQFSLPWPPAIAASEVPTSLILESARAFATEGHEALMDFSPLRTRLLRFAKDRNAIVRIGANMLMKRVLVEVAVDEFRGTTIIDAINDISFAFYERSSAKGRLILARPTDSSICIRTALKEPIELQDTTGARKLLEACGEHEGLLYDGDHLYGMGSLDAEGCQEDRIAEVIFRKAGYWILRAGETDLLQFKNGVADLPTPPIDERGILETIERVFGADVNDEVFSNLLKEIASLDHGTIVIVSSEAQEEAQRLRKQGTQIEPRVLNQGEFQSVSSIDGALLFDPNGRCHAIGVVLDGMAKENLGDPSRGSRYNSMIKYVQTRVDLNKSVVGVVFSDDGYSNYYSGMHGADVSS